MTLHKMFTDNMVLQANKPVRIFGQGSGVAKVRFCGKTYPAMRIFVQERIGEYEGIKSNNIHPIDKRIVSERVYNVLFEGEASCKKSAS